MDEGFGVIVIIAIVGAILWFIAMAIYYTAAFFVWLFGSWLTVVVGMAALGMLAGAIYFRVRGENGRQQAASARIGPFEADPKSWFFGSTAALVATLILYRMVAF